MKNIDWRTFKDGNERDIVDGINWGNMLLLLRLCANGVEKQLSEYLDYWNLNTGYMLSFNFNKKKEN